MVQLKMKEEGNKKEQAFENEQGLRYHKKEARKIPFFEVTFHSENGLYATYSLPYQTLPIVMV